MNKYLIFASVISMAFARPDGLLHGDDGHVSVTQSSAGTYKYTVHLKDGIRSEERLADGTIIGEYSVPDANGVSRTIKYTSGTDGFRILEGDLPVAPIVSEASGADDVPIVVDAKVLDETHTITVADAKNSGLIVPLVESSGAFLPGNPAPVEVSDSVPVPVEDTPEVKAAKQEFFALHKAAAAMAV